MGLLRLFFGLFCIFTFAASAWAGGAQQTNVDGIPYKWNGTVTYNIDQGDLKGGELNHAAARQLVVDAFETWDAALNSGGLSIVEGTSLPLPGDGGEDVTANNYLKYMNSGADVNPIIFDEDGEIIDSIYGECARFSMLAFAGFEKTSGSTVEKARIVFSGACIPDSAGNTVTKAGCGPCPIRLDEPMIRQMFVHEVGHLLGMDHSQVNPDSYKACNASGLCPVSYAQDIPTMFPIAVAGADMVSLHADDIAYFNRLYGDPELDGCSVSGRVLANDGVTELRGVEVVARNVDESLSKTDALAFMSGAEAPRFEAKDKSMGNCKEGCGDYLITGLSEGETYELCVQNILPAFTGASGIEPVDPPLPLVQPECFSNIQLTCTCSDSGCQAFAAQDLVTQPGSADAFANLSQDDFSSAAGGCSLVKPMTGIWRAWVSLL